MVKPPKTMQPEGVNLEKAGRAAGKAFQDDSHRNYMARKIDMQRKQFGLVIPPDPRDHEVLELEVPTKSPEVRFAPDPRKQEDVQEAPTKPRPEVRFAPDVQDIEVKPKKRKRKKLGMASVLRRLKRRHGRAGASPRSTETVQEDGHESEAPEHAALHSESHCDALHIDSETVEGDAFEGCHETDPPAHAALHSDSHCDALQIDSGTVKEDVYEGCHETDPPAHAALHLESWSVGATDCDFLQLDPERVKEDAYEGSHETDPPAHTAFQTESRYVCAPYCDSFQMDSGSTFEQEDESPPKSSIAAAQSLETLEGDLVERVNTPKKSTPPTKRVPVRPDLFFTGVVILVNGYTNPDTETLQRLMHKHGGDLEKYETVRLTHIIAEHLSTAKAKIYKRQRRPVPVCSPKWVVDCVASKRLLPHAPYLIKEVRDSNVGMKSVVSYFQGDPVEKKAKQQHPQDSDLELVGKKAVGYSVQSREGSSMDVSENLGPSMDVEFWRQTCSKIAAASLAESNHPTTLAPQGLSSNAHTKPIANDCVNTVSDTKKPGIFSTKNDDKYINGRVRTTGTDPHFLESFFNKSRLSFIGSYKQRARQTLQTKAARRNGERRFVFHVDMDCFFASVVLRSFPEYQDKPVAISHHGKKRSSDSSAIDSPVSKNSTSECATCNYHARKFGVKKGMYLGRARELCPNLITLQYDFEGYEEVSEQVTDILYQHAEELNGIIEQVSCDEAYMEIYVIGDGNKSPESIVGELAERIRKEVFDATQCTATVGVATNRMLAKLATDRVKPNNTFVVEDYRDLVRNLNLRDLHGIGYRSEQKLLEEGLVTVQDVWDLGSQAEGELCRILGPGLGKKIFDSCNGRDDRPVEPAERKTIGAECNYGVRFNGPYGVDHVIEGLAKEVGRRMESVAVKGTKVTLKVKQRKEGAPPPPKFLGHGSCHNLSKSLDTPDYMVTRDWKVIHRLCATLFAELGVPKEDVRGVGITLSKLVSDDSVASNPKESKQSITNWFSGKPPCRESSILAADIHFEDAARDVRGPQLTTNVREGHDDDDEDEVDEILVISSQGVWVNPGRDDSPSFKDLDEPLDDTIGNIVLSEEDHAYDISLPPLSQIRMSQVEYLPTQMRKQVESKMESRRELARQSPELAGKIECRRELAKQPPKVVEKGSLFDKQVLAAYGHGVAGKDPRFRQTDVKRMMRLAAVKSGKESLREASGESVSMTQLGSLPLEMQLQVANGDDYLVGNLARDKTFDDRTDRKRAWKPNVDSAETRERKIERPAPRVKPPPRHTLSEGDQQPLICVPRRAIHVDPRAFFRENILPLTVFMDENPEAEPEAVSFVVEFLCLCVTERGLCDVATLLRLIKNRGDAWSRDTLTAVVQAVNEKVEQKYGGARLDPEWLFPG